MHFDDSSQIDVLVTSIHGIFMALDLYNIY